MARVVATDAHKVSLGFLFLQGNLVSMMVLRKLHILIGERERIGLHFCQGGCM